MLLDVGTKSAEFEGNRFVANQSLELPPEPN